MKVFTCATCILSEMIHTPFFDALMYQKASGNYRRERRKIRLLVKSPGVKKRRVIYKTCTMIKRVPGRRRIEDFRALTGKKEVMYPGQYYEQIRYTLVRRLGLKFNTLKDFESHLR